MSSCIHCATHKAFGVRRVQSTVAIHSKHPMACHCRLQVILAPRPVVPSSRFVSSKKSVFRLFTRCTHNNCVVKVAVALAAKVKCCDSERQTNVSTNFVFVVDIAVAVVAVVAGAPFHSFFFFPFSSCAVVALHAFIFIFCMRLFHLHSFCLLNETTRWRYYT